MLKGEVLGVSGWRTIPQDLVDRFADVTDDHQFIHVDVERAKAGPFGRTIAHGFLLLALAPSLLREVVRFDGASMVVNAGLDRVRFSRPVPVDDRIRLSASVLDVDHVADDALDVVLKLSYNVEHQARPACVAHLLLRLVSRQEPKV